MQGIIRTSKEDCCLSSSSRHIAIVPCFLESGRRLSLTIVTRSKSKTSRDLIKNYTFSTVITLQHVRITVNKIGKNNSKIDNGGAPGRTLGTRYSRLISNKGRHLPFRETIVIEQSIGGEEEIRKSALIINSSSEREGRRRRILKRIGKWLSFLGFRFDLLGLLDIEARRIFDVTKPVRCILFALLHVQLSAPKILDCQDFSIFNHPRRATL